MASQVGAVTGKIRVCPQSIDRTVVLFLALDVSIGTLGCPRSDSNDAAARPPVAHRDGAAAQGIVVRADEIGERGA